MSNLAITVTGVTIVGSNITITGTIAAQTFTQPAKRITVPQIPATNPNFSRQVQVTDDAVFVLRNNAANNVALLLPGLGQIAVAVEPTLSYAPYITGQPVAASATFAKGTITSDGTNVSDGDTVTIGSKTYTFKTTLTSTEGQVHIGASATASLQNLVAAINHTGTPGTDYFCAAANTQVDAVMGTSAATVVSLTIGTAANSIATTTTAGHLSWGAATLGGGTAAPQFAVTVSSEIAVTYQWQYSADGLAWSNCTGTVNGTTYTNGTTATLTATPTTTGQNNIFHRCQITNSLGTVTTVVVQLTLS